MESLKPEIEEIEKLFNPDHLETIVKGMQRAKRKAYRVLIPLVIFAFLFTLGLGIFLGWLMF